MIISKEVRIGLLATISLVIFFSGFYFLKGADLFSKDNIYYCNYTNVDGLLNSATVEIRGLVVGHITSLELEEERGVKVTIAVRKDVIIPQGTVATIVSAGLLDGKNIRLDLGKSSSVAEPKSTLLTAEEPGVMDNVTKEITPLIAALRKTVASLDTVIAGVNIVLGEDNRNGIKGTIASINTTADNLAKMTASLNGETENVKGILRNANSFSANLAKNNDTLSRIMANFSNVSNQMAKAPLQRTLAQFDSVSTQLNGITTKINKGEGSLGQLINNKDLYTNMTNLLGDLKAHPSRYINVTVFGKKKKD
ncbi:hypothetical protein CJD36_014800 [Flavipsychrobacter stenotrophus]|uniref:Mce/MlaD domain-containing protein n=1 Tax=Flavipsychrobacter stenotrophus TaxID=2077091 RepID=A0A2S7STW8_9BACT|nr:MlaD family protein [Flavipsychrobacter stenotrophus]PQJ09966.1 hypothetical protein CJD36_014800 [Flavipsychrobacter stenotrophus]